MNYSEAKTRMNGYRAEIAALRSQIRETQATAEPEPVEDYVFSTPDGQVTLSELFGDKDTLFIVHNMGRNCAYCTLWADGLNGVIEHLQNRAAVAVSSPDAPAVQSEFAAGRGWRFTMVSHDGTTFAKDMGYRGDNGWMPGVSVFKRTSDGVVRVSDTDFGPGDDFCAVWHLYDLIPEGADGWQPKYDYAV